MRKAIPRLAAVVLLISCGRHQDVFLPLDSGVGPDRMAPGDGGLRDGGSGECSPGEEMCSGPYVLECGPNGQWHLAFACTYGCVENHGEARCGDLVLPGGIEEQDLRNASGTVALEPGDYLLDTGTGTWNGPSPVLTATRVIDRSSLGLPDILVLSMGELNIPAGCVVRVRGTKIPAFVVAGPIEIDGVLDLSAGPDGQPGPGGYPGGADGTAGQGPGAGLAGDTGPLGAQRAGGGGGGFGGLGGQGGSTPGAQGGLGGSRYGNPGLDPIVGGSGGGGGAESAGAQPGHGGGGGGAILLLSLTEIRIGSLGVVTAGGGGGGGGSAQAAGGGGGSGGAIFLMAPDVTVSGILAANGGAGGGADGGGDGESGRPDDVPARPGTGGGSGGAAATTDGTPGQQAAVYAGGGGGSVGRIRIESRAAPVIDGILSPGQETTAVSFAPLPVE